MELRERGSILILTIWILAILTLFGAAVGYQVRQRLRHLETIETRSKLREAADAGVWKAIHAIVRSREGSYADALHSRWANSSTDFRDVAIGEGTFTLMARSPDGRIRYGLSDEESKINLNEMLKLPVLTRLFKYAAGVSESEASNLAAALMDWIDEDDHLNAGGAEARYYRSVGTPYRPRNGKLVTLEELLLIKGITPEVFAEILPHVTLHSVSTVNINTASEEVLLACGLSEGLVKQLGDFFAGKDRERGTPDDGVFMASGSVGQDLSAVIPLDASEEKSLQDFVDSGLLDVRSHTFRVESHARLGSRRQAMAMACIFNEAGEINQCREFFYQIGPEIAAPVLLP